MQDFNQEPTSSQGTNVGLQQGTNQEPTNSQGTNVGLQKGTNSQTHEVVTQQK